jgi:hypothetical protein
MLTSKLNELVKELHTLRFPAVATLKATNELTRQPNLPTHLYILSPFCFFYKYIKRTIEYDKSLLRQTEWNKLPTKLNKVKYSIQPSLFPANILRKQETTIIRLMIGHTFLIHSHLIKKEESPICGCCGIPLTTKHILTEYREYDMERRHFQISHHLVEIFNPKPTNIYKQLLSETQLINKL